MSSSQASNSEGDLTPRLDDGGLKRNHTHTKTHKDDEKEPSPTKRAKTREQNDNREFYFPVPHSLRPATLDAFRAAASHHCQTRMAQGHTSNNAFLSSLQALGRSDRVKFLASDNTAAKNSLRGVQPYILGSAFLIRNELSRLRQNGYPLDQAVNILTNRIQSTDLDSPWTPSFPSFEEIADPLCSLQPSPTIADPTPKTPSPVKPEKKKKHKSSHAASTSHSRRPQPSAVRRNTPFPSISGTIQQRTAFTGALEPLHNLLFVPPGLMEWNGGFGDAELEEHQQDDPMQELGALLTRRLSTMTPEEKTKLRQLLDRIDETDPDQAAQTRSKRKHESKSSDEDDDEMTQGDIAEKRRMRGLLSDTDDED